MLFESLCSVNTDFFSEFAHYLVDNLCLSI
nr:MAG TPA: hypothetical protein [Caudoviricetes sp.]